MVAGSAGSEGSAGGAGGGVDVSGGVRFDVDGGSEGTADGGGEGKDGQDAEVVGEDAAAAAAILETEAQPRKDLPRDFPRRPPPTGYNADHQRRRAAAAAAVEEVEAVGGGQFYTAAELRAPGPYPPGVAVTRRETYLDPAEFEQLFGVSKEAFEGLPGWKKLAQRKKLLFW